MLIVGIPGSNPGNGRSVSIVVSRQRFPDDTRIGFIEFVVATEFFVIDIDTVVIDSYGNTLAGKFEFIPHRNDIDHVVDPYVRSNLWISFDGIGWDARQCGIVPSRKKKIGRNGTAQDFIGRLVQFGILTSGIAGTIITSGGAQTSETIGIEFLAYLMFDI